MYSIVNNIFAPLKRIVTNFCVSVLSVFLAAVVLFFIVFFVRYRINPFKMRVIHLKRLSIKFKPYDLMRYILVDLLTGSDGKFHEHGFTLYCGRQGAGKTISMVEYLNRMIRKYPKCKIVTNFAYLHADHIMTGWRDLMEIRNGEEGVIFAIDEIHSEYSSSSWKDFPESILSEISQQRKQKVKIVSTSQAFSRVVKPIREQSVSVVQCSTYFGRFTRNIEYDAIEYAAFMDRLFNLKKKCKKLGRYSFVQSDYLRSCYDTYEKIERMQKVDFLPRSER